MLPSMALAGTRCIEASGLASTAEAQDLCRRLLCRCFLRSVGKTMS